MNISCQCVLNEEVVHRATIILERASKVAKRQGPNSHELYTILSVLDGIPYYGDILKARFIHLLSTESISNMFQLNSEMFHKDLRKALVEFYKQFNKLYS